MRITEWQVLARSLLTRFIDQVAKASLVSPSDFPHEILGQLQIALRTGQADMTKIRG